MGFLLGLLGVILCFLLVRAWQIIWGENRRRRSSVPPSPQNDVSRASAVPRRSLLRVSMEEFAEILLRSEDLFVLDLRPRQERGPFPLPEAQVLCIRTSDLERVLASLPADRSVAFYGASALCLFMVETSTGMQGSAPLYVLSAERAHGEAA